MLDSKDTSYISVTLNLIDRMMTLCKEEYIEALIREGVLSNIKSLISCDQSEFYVVSNQSDADLLLSDVENNSIKYFKKLKTEMMKMTNSKGEMENLDNSLEEDQFDDKNNIEKSPNNTKKQIISNEEMKFDSPDKIPSLTKQSSEIPAQRFKLRDEIE